MTLAQRFATGEYTVVRPKKGTYVKGRYVPGPKETITVSGSLQPTNARELKLPEEGNRLKQFFKFFTDEPVLVGSTATLAAPDTVVVDGETYRAMALTTWKGTDLDYFACVIWRDPQQADDGTGAGA